MRGRAGIQWYFKMSLEQDMSVILVSRETQLENLPKKAGMVQLLDLKKTEQIKKEKLEVMMQLR